MMIYIDGESEKKIVQKAQSNHSKSTIIVPSDFQGHPIERNNNDLVVQKKNKEANIIPGF